MAFPWSAGDKLNAADLNAVVTTIITTLNAGETVSAYKVVYMDDTDNEWKYCDGNDTGKLQFAGFSLEAGTDGNPMDVQTDGIVSGLSGLDAGKVYYISDTAGEISTTPGTYLVQVGIAISSTKLLILKGERTRSGTYSLSRTQASGNGTESDAVTLGFRPKIILVTVDVSGSGGSIPTYGRGILFVNNGGTNFGYGYSNATDGNIKDVIGVVSSFTAVVDTPAIVGTLSIASLTSTGFTVQLVVTTTAGSGRTVSASGTWVALG